MSSVQRGREYEKEVERILQAKGYRTERAYGKIAWIFDKKKRTRKPITISHDFFGLFDIIAVHPEAGRHVKFIQVTTWEMVSARRNKILNDWRSFKYGYFMTEIWARVRGGKKPHFKVLSHHDNDFASDSYNVEFLVAKK